MHAIICILELMNFMLFLIKFIEFKQRIKFKKFELHNYGPNFLTCSGLGWVSLLMGWVGSGHNNMDPWTTLAPLPGV